MSELESKLGRIQQVLDGHALDALLLQDVANFAWATCGAVAYVNVADPHGVASVLISPNGRYVLTDNIEAARLQEEEGLSDQGWEFRIAPWYEHNGMAAELTQGFRLGTDHCYPGATDVHEEIARLRSTLSPEEIDRFRLLSRACAEAMDAAIMSIRPGLTEHQIAGMLVREALNRGVEPIIHLVGTDERAYQFRHPLPTAKRLERHAMLVLCGRKWGLVSSITRLIHFGRIPDELRNKGRAVALVDAHLIAATRPGQKLRDIFHEGMNCYRTYGFEGEWQQHHQGGLTGYAPREIVVTPETEEEVSVGQVYAWSPSIAGAKSEDTILVGEHGNEILTAIPHWPVVKVNLRGQTLERPLILEVV